MSANVATSAKTVRAQSVQFHRPNSILERRPGSTGLVNETLIICAAEIKSRLTMIGSTRQSLQP